MKNKKIELIALMLFGLFMALFVYALFHEIGHGIIGLIAGGKIDNIVLGFNAHISISNADYSSFTLPLMNIFGLVFPIILLIIALLFYNEKIKNIFYHIIYIFSSVITIFSALPWIIIPLLSYFTRLPENEDVTQFLNTSNMNPMLLSLLSLLVIAFLIYLIIKKGILKRYIELIKFFKNDFEKQSDR